MNSKMNYIVPNTCIYSLAPKERMMQTGLANTGGDAQPAPVRFPEDN